MKPANKVAITIATPTDREAIFKLRHDIYASELGQHNTNEQGQLKDNLDEYNIYIVARVNGEVGGFISITPPSSPTYSVDKYFDRSLIPFVFDKDLYEIRILTVAPHYRTSSIAALLMYAAKRWVEAHGAQNIVAICRTDLITMYISAGLKPLEHVVNSGSVSYQLSVATIDDLNKVVAKRFDTVRFLQDKIDWQLPFAYFPPSSCYHGGSFFKAIGEDLATLERKEEVINADVLDAWFPPSPKVIQTLTKDLAWLLQTSPPTHCGGLINKIASTRGVSADCILPGAGSSNLIFLALQNFLNKHSKVLILDPCYGEYQHVLEKVIQCEVSRFRLNRSEGFKVDKAALLAEILKGYDMIILVNPNSPTGFYVPKSEMEELLRQVPINTLVWVDETYIDYSGRNNSLEPFAVSRENIIVCKSMSKIYALSGARVAYLCCSLHLLETLRALTPPWSISLPAQLAAITALDDTEYYYQKYYETSILRDQLKRDLRSLGIEEIIEGVANFLLFYLPAFFPAASSLIDMCQKRNLFLRDVTNMGTSLGEGAIRIAVKDAVTNGRMIAILEEVISEHKGQKQKVREKDFQLSYQDKIEVTT